MAVKFYDVRAGHEWAEFYVNERDPVTAPNGHLYYEASWCCLSSYGVFGYHWLSMGCQFKQFVSKLEEDYLLSKIGRKIASADVIERSVKEEILRFRKEFGVSEFAKLEARSAWDAVDAIVAEGHSAEVTAMKIYEDDDISKIVTEWTEINTMEWDNDAVQFVRKLWPAFVEALNIKESSNA